MWLKSLEEWNIDLVVTLTSSKPNKSWQWMLELFIIQGSSGQEGDNDYLS